MQSFGSAVRVLSCHACHRVCLCRTMPQSRCDYPRGFHAALKVWILENIVCRRPCYLNGQFNLVFLFFCGNDAVNNIFSCFVGIDQPLLLIITRYWFLLLCPVIILCSDGDGIPVDNFPDGDFPDRAAIHTCDSSIGRSACSDQTVYLGSRERCAVKVKP